jgi:LmbE family N-acetylglucosaminyl deacetylase
MEKRSFRTFIAKEKRMMKLTLSALPSAGVKLLCLGAHSDDIEIGCGGTILRLMERYPSLDVTWVVFSAPGRRRREALESAQAFLSPVKHKTIRVKNFRDGYFPYDGALIKKEFESLKKKLQPDLVLTHYRQDRHQDHRTISDLTWNTFRDHFILEYEIPKYDGDFGTPNFYVELSKAIAEQKRDHLMTYFLSQQTKHWFTPELLFSILRLRGMESGRSSEYVEAFYSRKGVL